MTTLDELERLKRAGDFESVRRLEKRLGIKPSIKLVESSATPRDWLMYRRRNKFEYADCQKQLRTAISRACLLRPVDEFLPKGRTTWAIVDCLARIECNNDYEETKNDCLIVSAYCRDYAEQLDRAIVAHAKLTRIELPSRTLIRPTTSRAIDVTRNPATLIDHYLPSFGNETARPYEVRSYTVDGERYWPTLPIPNQRGTK